MTDTIKNALDVLRLMQSLYECDLLATAPEWSHSLRQAVTDLEALTQRPAAQPSSDAIREHLEGVARRSCTDEQFKAFEWVIDTAFDSLDLLPAPQQATPSDAELPGMWSTSDLIGGETDTQQATQSREASEAEQRARMQARLATRPEGKATADFDLPAPNDAIKKATPEPLTEHADHIPEIAARLRLVAKLAGCADAVPADDLTAVGCIFSVLGNMRRELERKKTSQERTAFDPMAEANRIVSASAKNSANDDNWRKLFWALAKELNCLPSSFVDGNEHVLRKAQELQARAAKK